MDARPKRPHASSSEKVVVAASGFTSLWALSWIGSSSLPLSGGVQGGFAVGGVMASSGLALLWWRTKTMRAIAASNGEKVEPDPDTEVETDPTTG